MFMFFYMFLNNNFSLCLFLTIGLKFCITDKRVIPHAHGLGFHAQRARAWGLIRAARDDDPPLDEGVRRYAKLLVSRIGFWKNVFFWILSEEKRSFSDEQLRHKKTNLCLFPLPPRVLGGENYALRREGGEGKRGSISLSPCLYIYFPFTSL